MQADERRGGRPDPLIFGVGETQAIAQPLRILRDCGRERGEPQESVGPTTPLGLNRDEAAEASGISEAAEDRLEKAAFAHRLHDVARARRHEELHQFGAHALPRKAGEAVARPDRGRKAVGVERASSVSGREAEKAQDAQVILADALAGVADEAHAALGEILEPADSNRGRFPQRRARAR